MLHHRRCLVWTPMLLGSDINLTMTLFAEAFPGLQATAVNGNEGQAFRDVLLDVLQADDTDGDLTNGVSTPRVSWRLSLIHGITLLITRNFCTTICSVRPMHRRST